SARRGRGRSCEREHLEELVERGDPFGARPVDREAARVRGREHAAPEALPRGLAEARLRAPDGAHLAGEPDLPPHDHVVGERAAAGGGGDRRDHGQVGRRLVDAEPARHVQEHVLVVERQPHALLEHGEQERHAARGSGTRGPASVPSLVTWPMRKQATPLAFARATSSAADSRTCPTLPGAEPRAPVWSVWIESTTTAAGCVSPISSATTSAAVSATTSTPASAMPRRSARSRTC